MHYHRSLSWAWAWNCPGAFARRRLHGLRIARNEEALKALTEESAAGTNGGVVKVCTLDQSDDAAVQDFVEQVKSEENQVDLLVNSAFAGLIAITPHFGKPFWERPLSVFDASLNIGLRSAM